MSTTLVKKLDLKAKAQTQNKLERANLLEKEITEIQRQGEMAKENFDNISRIIKKEVESFDMQRVIDFKNYIRDYLQALLKCQESITAEWENFLQEMEKQSINQSS